MRDKRSMLNFGLLLIIAIGTTIFVLNKAQQAIAEVDALAASPVFIGQHVEELK